MHKSATAARLPTKSTATAEHRDLTAGELEALAARLAPLILARFALALGATEVPYSTRKGYEPPEFIGRNKTWKKTAPTIPGAVQIGRWWSIPRSAYARWLESQGTAIIAAPSVTAGVEPWSPESALRLIGGGR